MASHTTHWKHALVDRRGGGLVFREVTVLTVAVEHQWIGIVPTTAGRGNKHGDGNEKTETGVV